MKKIDISNYETLMFFIIRACFLGICSNNLYIIAKQNSYISVILSIFLGIVPLIIYLYIIKSYPDKNIFEIIEEILGKKIGNIISGILSIFVFFFAIVIFYNLINFIGSQYLFKTPDIAIAIMFGFCFFFLLRKGLKTIAITSTILFYLFAILYLLSVLGLISQVNISNLFPFNEYPITSIFNGTFNIIALNISPVFLLTLIPYNKIDNKENFVKKSIIFYLLGTITILLVVFFTISIFSPNLAIIMQYPEFHLLKRLSLIGFIERVENILSIQLIFVMIITISYCYYFFKEFIIKFFKNKTNKKHIIIDLLIYLVSTIVVLNIFKSNTMANEFYLKKFNILTFIFFLVLPLFISFIIFIKKNILNK